MSNATRIIMCKRVARQFLESEMSQARTLTVYVGTEQEAKDLCVYASNRYASVESYPHMDQVVFFCTRGEDLRSLEAYAQGLGYETNDL